VEAHRDRVDADGRRLVDRNGCHGGGADNITDTARGQRPMRRADTDKTLHPGRELQQALLSRDVIGQAKGILMERLKVTPEDPFDLLRRSSQHLNLKLRDVARGLTETGEPGQQSPVTAGQTQEV
jgi:ANTAR domain